MRPVALVTGASRRLGRALAEGAARAGHDVAVHYRTDPGAATEAVAALVALGARAEAIRSDLREAGAARRLVEEVLSRFLRLDLLVHSASPWLERPPEEVSEADWDDVFAVGPRAGFFLAQAAAPALSRTGGAIVLVSDVAATKAWPRHLPHSVSKAAVDALVRNLAVALAPAVRVNGVAPGIVLPPDDLPEAEVAKLVARTPLRRHVSVDDLVSAALALSSNRSITGQVL
ncbi:MAG: SDR family oxidoreductase, partial [Thermoanaerobaculia bacterium]|nr:SDR family oxidoreductase [Thermoanaerobaculia bacterium]